MSQAEPRLVPLPCPFCGKVPAVIPEHPRVEGNAWGAVQCVNMRCASYDGARGHGVSVGDGSIVADERGSGAYRDAAIRRWNKRKG